MKQPKLRFKANDGNQYPEWEEKRLEEVAVRITRKNKDNCTDIPLTISSLDGLIDQRDFFNKIVASKDMSGYYLLKRGEFAYNKSYSKGFDFGSIKRLNLYDEGALSTLYICFALNNNEDSDFYQKYFDSLSWYPELQKICAEGARNHGLLNVSTNDFFQLKLHVPKSKEEQQEIASLFTELDNLIQSAQKELDGYRELKQGMLQKMFPKKGEKVPEIRFPEFTGDWEEKTFNDIAVYKKGPFGSALKKKIFVPKSNNTVKVYEQQNAISKDWRLERYFVTDEYFQANMKSFSVSGGDIIVSCAGTIGEIYELPNDAEEGIINQALMRVRIKKSVINSMVFKCVFDKMISSEGIKISNGSALKNIPPFADMKKQPVLLPSLPEQEKIGKYFSSLDNLIALQQKELDGYKELKKGLLQQMFC